MAARETLEGNLNHIWLVQACSLEPEAALEAYGRWKTQTEFEQLNTAAFALLPHLYQHLQTHLNDELTPRLVGIYKQAWVMQQQRIHQQEQWRTWLEQHKIAYALLDDAKLNISATADFAVKNINSVLAIIPKEHWLMSQQKYLLLWKTRGWVVFKHSTRVFAHVCPERTLHQLEYNRNDMVWLTRVMPELQSISDWQAYFAVAQKYGLRKRLYHALEIAQEAGVLKSVPLPTQFSSFDQLQYQFAQSQSWLSRVFYAYLIGLQKNQQKT
jgi:hypothetical protein